jgi:hypothetical protein
MTWRAATFVIWGVIGAALVAYGLLTRFRYRANGADALLRAWTTNPYRRGALLLAWMWLGWHAFAR